MLNIKSITDNPDGSADVLMEMDYDTLVKFAKIGILKVLEDAAENTIEPVEPEVQGVIPDVMVAFPVWSASRPLTARTPYCSMPSPFVMCQGCDCWKFTSALNSGHIYA
jgi:hypothetical protein